MPTIVDRDETFRLLMAEFDAVTDLAHDIAVAEWDRPTCLPGWSVKDQLSHLVGTELMLEGEPMPEVDVGHLTHVRNDIGASGELWVESMRPLSGPEVLERWKAVVERRRATLGAMDQAAFDAPSWTPAGPDETFGRFMRIRHFDAFMHEHDIRGALGRPDHDDPDHVRFALTEPVSGLGYVVGKRAGIPSGQRVQLDLTGPGEMTVFVEVGDRATVVDTLSGEPTIGIRLPAMLYLRLAGGRQDPAPHLDSSADVEQIELRGDEDLAGQLAANFAFTI
jgi:uncharacterized protein (TIGR03083 family)